MHYATISAEDGVYSLLASAKSGRNDNISFGFQGDLEQMAAQERFLRDKGFVTGRSGGIPGLLSNGDLPQALTLIWTNKVKGWWHYMPEYERFGICTEAEFKIALDVHCSRNR